MDAAAFVHHLVTLPAYRQQIVYVEHLPAREAVFGELNSPLHPLLQERLRALAISALYRHQAEALNALFAGKNIIMATPSASGKSLCYQLAALEASLSDKDSRAIFVFPTKALSQDQLRSLRELACPQVITEGAACTFDGDTAQGERARIKRRAKIVLTNPDMLHLGILPNHRSWLRLFRHLKYVVIDEAHVYRGILGSHMANVVRRLRRICTLYGSSPQFICCSGTTANPVEHAGRLVGLPVEAVVEDGSPRGDKYFAFWNPPFVGEDMNSRRSANSEAAYLLTELVQKGFRSLVFARTRKLTELVCLYAKDQLAPDLSGRLSPYRAGYLPEERRRIEQRFFDGDLLGMVATTALELGVDIGGLEATVLAGYPGSIASAWQQAGRSGRSTGSSLSFLVGRDNPLDQYLMRHPEFFFGRSFDNALINPANPYVLMPHLLCAAWEKPIDDTDRALFDGDTDAALAELSREGKMRRWQMRWHLSPALAYPAQDVSIRATSGQYAVVDISQGRLLETVEASVAFLQIHPGAVYLHQGESYLVTELDPVQHTALAEPTQVNYYTQARETTEIRVLGVSERKDCRGVTVCWGTVDVTSRVVGFRKKRQFGDEMAGDEALELPSQSFVTRSLWFDLPQKAIDRIAEAGLDLEGGLHACEHAAISILPLFALCDRDDIGGVSVSQHRDTGVAQVFIYDAYPGGIGIAERGFEVVDRFWRATLELVRDCPCHDGCPSCIQSPKCGNNNQPLDKEAALILLEELAISSTEPEWRS